MFCIFEWLASAAQVINAKHEGDGRLMKKSYGQSRVVLLCDASPSSIPSPSHSQKALAAMACDGGCYVYSYLASPLRRQSLLAVRATGCDLDTV